MKRPLINKKIFLSPRIEKSNSINELLQDITKNKNLNQIRNNSGRIFFKISKTMRKESNLSQPNLIDRNHKKNYTSYINFKIKKENSYLDASIIKSSKEKKEKINDIKDEKIDLNNINSPNSSRNDLKYDKSTPSHNTKITDLLNKTERFFNSLGFYLNENNKKDFINFDKNNNYKKIKINKIDFNKALRNKQLNDINDNNKKLYIKRKENESELDSKNNEIFYKYKYMLEKDDEKNNNKYIDIMEKESDKNDTNQFSKYIIDKEIDKIKNSKNSIYNENNDNLFKNSLLQNNWGFISNLCQTDEKDINNKNFKHNNNQLDNTSNLLEQYKNKEYKYNILPPLSSSMDKIKSNRSKNEIKIAEVRRVYPVYPYNRIDNIVPKKNKFNYNVNRKFLFDLVNKFSHDDRYNYERIMNNIRHLSNNNKSTINDIYNNNIYKYKSISSKKYFYKNWKKLKLK
jgi:hypothetical protein